MQTTPQALITQSIEITRDYDVLDYPNGGYLASLATSLIAAHVQHPDPLTLSASFLGHPTSGPADVAIELLDVKKSMTRATLTLSQQGEKKAFYVATFSDFARSTGLTHRFPRPQVAITPHSQCVPVSALGLPSALAAFTGRFDMRLAPGCLNRPGPGQPAEIEGWIALADGTPATLASLVLFADAFPPPVFNAVDPSQWGSVPTVDYSVHLKAAPCPGPVHGRFWSNEVVKGYIEIDGELRDTQGQLVAVSRQIAKFRGALAAAS